MARSFDQHPNIADCLDSWRWQEQFTKPRAIPYCGDDNYDPSRYNYSYSEFRKQRPYLKTPANDAYKEFITALMPLRHDDPPDLHPNDEYQNKIYIAISDCLEYPSLPATDLLVGALYSSYHLVSPYILPTIKYLLLTCSDSIYINVTSISNPRYTVPHIAAMSNDTSLLNVFYEIDGSNIDIIDGSSFTPLHISLGKRNFKVSHTLLWMNCMVDQQRLIKKLRSFRLRHLMNSVSCLQHFALQFENAFGAINECLVTQWSLNRDITQTLVSFLLPVRTYSAVHGILEKLERNQVNEPQIEEHDDLQNDEKLVIRFRYQTVVEEATKCLQSLMEFKTDLISNLDEMEPRMVLYNLFALTQEEEMESYLHGDEYNLQRWKDKIKLVVGKKEKQTMFDKNDGSAKKSKGAIMGFVAATAAFITVRSFRK